MYVFPACNALKFLIIISKLLENATKSKPTHTIHLKVFPNLKSFSIFKKLFYLKDTFSMWSNQIL
jgi:hypothetical protein